MTLAGTRCAVYARFSTELQSSSSVEDQVARARRYAEEHGVRLDPDLVFADFALSGASTARPGLQALLAAVNARRVDVVLVESIDRIARNEAHLHAVLDRCRYLDVRVIGIGDQVDTGTGTGGRMLASLRAMMGMHYLSDLADKTRRGQEGRARAGLATGGQPFGYRTTARAEGGRAIEIDPAAADVVRRIFRAAADGKSADAIASALNAEGVSPPRSSRRIRRPTWQRSTIRSMLANERYRGVVTFGEREWRKNPDTGRREAVLRKPQQIVRTERPELRIVDEELWLAVNGTESAERPARAAERRARARRAYLFSGLLRCSCGSPMQIHGGSSRSYYRCTDSKVRGVCPVTESVAEDEVRTRLLGAIAGALSGPAVERLVRRMIDEVLAGDGGSAELDAARRAVATTEAQIERLVDALAGGGAAPATVLARIRELEATAAAGRARVRELERRSKPTNLPSVDEVLERVRRLRLGLDRLDRPDDVAAGRERLRTVLRGPFVLTPTEDRQHFTAASEVLPAVLLGLASGRGVVRIAGAGFAHETTTIPGIPVAELLRISGRRAA